MAQTTKNSKIIKASVETIFKAFSNPNALEVWQAPNDMVAKVHHFNFKVSGGYEMSLLYPENETEIKGKTTLKEDRFMQHTQPLYPTKR